MHGDFVEHIYPIELEIKDTTNTDRFPSYLDLHLEIDIERNFTTRHDFNFPIVNFPFICKMIHISTFHQCMDIYISWFDIPKRVVPIRISLRVAANKEATEPRFPMGKVEIITSKVLWSSPWLVNGYGTFVSQMSMDMFHLS